jgi:membrane-associated phospholipid phosphatase
MTAPRHQTTAMGDGREPALLWRRLAAASGLGFLCSALAYVLFVWTSLGQRFDDDAFVGSGAVSSRIARVATDQVHLITLRTFSVAVVVLVLIGIVRRRPRLGVALGLGGILAVAVSYEARTWFLPHPILVKGANGLLATGTFPSGHTTTVMALALAVMVVVAPRWRGVVAVGAGAYTSAVSVELQIVWWHRPSDVIGGAFLAFAVITGAAALVARYRPVTLGPARPGRIPLILLSGTGIVAAGIAISNLITVWGRLPDPSAYPKMSASFHAARQAGLAATVFVVLLLVTVLLVLMGRADLDGRRPDVVYRSDVANRSDVEGEGARPLSGQAPGTVTPAGLTRPLWMRPLLWRVRRPRPAGATSR